MKKLFTGVLALALAASVGVTAFAAENSATIDGTKNTTADVNGVYQTGGESPDTVAVDISWNDMSFNYTEGKKTWDPDTHEVMQEGGTWSSDVPKYVALINHSNVEVHAAFAFQGVGNIHGVFTNDNLALESGKNYTVDEAREHEQVTFLSIQSGRITKTGKIGTITVTLTVPKAAEAGTEDELYAALSSVSTTSAQIRLTDNITLTKSLKPDAYTKAGCVIDLNGKTISCATDTAVYALQSNITFKNGTITSLAAGDGKFVVRADAQSIITLENCTLNAGGNIAIQGVAGTIHLTDCTIVCDTYYTPINLQSAYGTGSDLTVRGKTTIQTKSFSKVAKDDGSTVKFEAGTYNFDPTKYVDAEAYTVTKDESADIWTVAAN